MENLFSKKQIVLTHVRYEGKERLWFLSAQIGENCRKLSISGQSLKDALLQVLSVEGGA